MATLTLSEVQALAQLLSIGSGRYSMAEREWANSILARLEADAKKQEELVRPGRTEVTK